MTYVLKNELLSVTLSDKGAEVISVKNTEGYEYIWQGDPKYWEGQAPLMFPICGRLFGGKYTYGDKEFEMNLHGFARKSVFSVREADDTHAVFVLTDIPESLAEYPFPFVLSIEYRLCGNSLTGSVTVENSGSETLPFTVGLHPGFNVPLGEGRIHRQKATEKLLGRVAAGLTLGAGYKAVVHR